MAQAASGDQFEIRSGQLALQRSTNPAVRNLASLVIADHMRTSRMIAAAAKSVGIVPPPPSLLPPHQAMLDRLRSSLTFDQDFEWRQRDALQQALKLHQNYASSGDNRKLRSVAAKAVPIIQMHLQQAQFLNTAPPTVPPPPPPPIR
ncbi:MAG: DUF4142 domain-containing protein [Sphingomonas sp.]|uniref:DUF4142 domain-containing protein n=1 Tax=Sphingomonas sp. TaxID=28214 RepID=UPI001795A034|nr:DUF4142 domain-containing protein [Sphingomonas sp.]MBA3667784.1 DUF4142 domain-containing protein [Sphingomonas sp.]